MFRRVQRMALSLLRNGGMNLESLLSKFPTPVTEIGLRRTLTQLKNGDLLTETKGVFELTPEGQTCMSSQGAEYAAAEKVNNKRKG